MKTASRLAGLRRRGLILTAEGGRLRFRAPAATLSPADREFLASSRAALLEILVEEASDPGGTGDDVGRGGRPGPGVTPGRSSPGPVALPTPAPRRTAKSDDDRGGFNSQYSGNSSEHALPLNFTNIANLFEGWDGTEFGGLSEGAGQAARTILVGTRTYPFSIWDGEELGGYHLGFGAVSALVAEGEAPRLALASASDGSEHRGISPARLGEFLLIHRNRHLVFFDVAAQYWIVERHLAGRGELAALEVWRGLADADRMHCGLLLDQLIYLARSDADPHPRDLPGVAYEYAGLRVAGTGPRLESRAVVAAGDGSSAERDAFDRVLEAPIASLAAYEAMELDAVGLMEAHGLDPVEVGLAHGLLGEAYQVKGAIALADVTRRGIGHDRERAQELERRHRERLTLRAEALRAMPGCEGLFKPDHRGRIAPTEMGRSPSLNEARLRDLLVGRARGVAARTGLAPPDPGTPAGKVAISADAWAAFAPFDPFIRGWLEFKRAAEACRFFGGPAGPVVHPAYRVLVRTGRTSCSGPNIQNMPRQGGFRECFVARPCHLLLILDYSFLELRTLAAVFEARYGWSTLADVIRAVFR